ncbi:uncharacterized protein A1O5_09392 [Cladophialophora psammophila CBS 110553]|uniref:ABM domain-containing protein n=1 Tax=Cladophialophora psammophila CBS 110553 TaxID=1182543 RepID=W9XAD2_9EURO|nr:uncharacterized protein A1O5_09392 [Cladophialophora psammophila CBS 110553]EXJ67379.1 hypothetical protein A1O5_09392 [Cladophialophora psammophila CBS 110553]
MGVKKTMFLVQVSVEPENIEKFLEAFREIVELCCKEPECERFEVFADTDEKGLFHWVETWNASREWVENVSPATLILRPSARV